MAPASDCGDTTPPPPAAPARVLVVDDEPAIRMAVSRILAAAGLFATTASDGAAALALLESGDPPNLLVTDVEMPEVTGEQLAAEVRHRWPELPILFMSGDRRHAALPGTHGAGVAFLLKPFEHLELLASVREALGA